MAIITSKWIIQEEEDDQIYCLWPTNFTTDSARMQAIEKHADVKIEDCSKNLINIKYSSAIYQNAVYNLKQLEECHSVPESDGGEVPRSRLRKPNRQLCDDFVQDCTSDEERIPTPPKLLPKRRQVDPSLRPTPNKRRSNTLSSSAVTSPQPISRSFSSAITSSPAVLLPSSSAVTSSPAVSRSSTPLSQIECKGCKRNQELITDVIVKLDSMREDIAYLISTNNNVARNNTESRVDLKEVDALKKKTLEEILNFDEKLGDIPEMAKVVSLLEKVGGKDLTDTTRRIMSRIMTNEVACAFNWTGKHEKAAFCQLKNLKNLIMVAVRKNRLCQHATEDDMERAMKTWLRNAPDREGGRSKRKKTNE